MGPRYKDGEWQTVPVPAEARDAFVKVVDKHVDEFRAALAPFGVPIEYVAIPDLDYFPTED